MRLKDFGPSRKLVKLYTSIRHLQFQLALKTDISKRADILSNHDVVNRFTVLAVIPNLAAVVCDAPTQTQELGTAADLQH